MTEKTLSEKRYQLKDFGLDGRIYRYDEEDVADAVRRLKEEVFIFSQTERDCCSKAEKGEINICRFCFPKLINSIFGSELAGVNQ